MCALSLSFVNPLVCDVRIYTHIHTLSRTATIPHPTYTQDNTRDEWKEQYIDYKALKKALKPLKASAKGKPWLKKGGSMAGGGGEGSDSGTCVPRRLSACLCVCLVLQWMHAGLVRVLLLPLITFRPHKTDEETAGGPALPPIAISLKERLLRSLGRNGGKGGGGGEEGKEGGDGKGKGGEERVGLLGAMQHARNISYDSMASVRFHLFIHTYIQSDYHHHRLAG